MPRLSSPLAWEQHLHTVQMTHPISRELNRLYADKQCQIYRDTKMINENRLKTWQIAEERRSVHEVSYNSKGAPTLWSLMCAWMAQDLGTYRDEIVRDINASYASTLRWSIDKREKPKK